MVYGHVTRREEEHVVRRVMTKEIPGKRKKCEIEGKMFAEEMWDCGTEIGRGRRQGVVESEDQQPATPGDGKSRRDAIKVSWLLYLSKGPVTPPPRNEKR